MSDFPFDFAVRLEDLMDGCIEGGNDPKVLQAYMRQLADEMDDPNSSVSKWIAEDLKNK